MSLYTYAVAVQKQEAGMLTSNLLHGYKTAASEDEARGAAYAAAAERFPGWSVTNLLVLQVQEEHLREALEGTPA